MKKTILPIVLLCLIALVIVVSCQKDYNNDGAGQTKSLNELFSGLRTTPQNLSVTAGRDTVVYGANGTMLHFYANSFKDASGNILTNGSVSLQLIEMYKPGDMICNRATTVANNQLLTSGGQINITATMNGQEIVANSYGLSFKQNNSSTQTMALFYSNTTNVDSPITWRMADTSNHYAVDSSHHDTIATITHHGTTATSTTCHSGFNTECYYVFDTCVNFHWINCDYIIDTTHLPLTTVSVVLPQGCSILNYMWITI